MIFRTTKCTSSIAGVTKLLLSFQKMENKPPKEKDIEKVIIKYLRFNGAYCQKVHSGSIMKSYVPKFGSKKGQKVWYRVKLADEGTPDILGCIPVVITPDMVGKTIGAFFAVEVKKDETQIRSWGRQKDERARNQKIQHSLIGKAWGVVSLAASFKTVQEDLKAKKYL